MTILKRILFGLVGLVVLLTLIGLLLPATAHVERSITVDAPPQTVFALANNLKRFPEWSPWHGRDPQMKQTFSGPDSGVGAKLAWSSDHPDVGSGTQEITGIEAPRRVHTHLDFGDRGTAEAEIVIEPAGVGSKVTWGFETDFGNNLIGRYFGLMMGSMLGPDYEKGLANLKAVAEADAAKQTAAAALNIEEIDVTATDIVAAEGTTSLDPAAITTALKAVYGQIGAFMKANQLQASGAPIAITRFYDESGWGFEAAIPFSATDAAKTKAQAAAAQGPLKIKQSYAGRALKATHIGPYRNLPDVYRQLEDRMAGKKLNPNGQPWEQYLNGPDTTPEDQLKTDVYVPFKPAE